MKQLTLATTAAMLCFASCTRQPKAAVDQTSEESYTSITREISTPSGDWGGCINYQYDTDGSLRHATYEFGTLTGYDKKTEEFIPTNCVREYDLSQDGELILVSTSMTDTATGDSVDRSFYDPEISHWMTLKEAQEKHKAEQVRADRPLTAQ